MNRVFSKIKIYIAAFIICIAVTAVFTASNANAEPKADQPFTLEVDLSSTPMYEYNGNMYLISSADQSFVLKYIITNTGEAPLSIFSVEINEMLISAQNTEGSKKYDAEVITLEPGESEEFEGEQFEFDSADSFMFQYNVSVVCCESAEELPDPDTLEPVSTYEILHIYREEISVDMIYDFVVTQSNIYKGDTVMLEAVLTSNSEVPLRNIMLYDTNYGFLGQIDVLEPGETKSINANVKVMESTTSSPYITYMHHAGTTTDRMDFSDSILRLEVTNHSFHLGMELFSDAEYIVNGQTVEVEFMITNLGSGVVQNIAVLDDFGETLFTISELEAGGIYTEKVELICAPNTKYSFNCISPQTETVSNYIEFSSMPGLGLKYMLDKPQTEYKYGDKMLIVYTVTNSGSVTAQNLILTDSGINKTWVIGEIKPGEVYTVSYVYEIKSTKTVIKPKVDGNYIGYDEPIYEQAKSTEINVEMPDRLAEIEMTYKHEPELVYFGDRVLFLFTFTNIGDGSLVAYSVHIVEENMVIASESELLPGASKTFSVELTVDQSKKFTVRVEGVNKDTGEKYLKDHRASVEAQPGGGISTPTEPPMETFPPATPEPVEKPKNDPLLITVIIVASLAVIMLIVTLSIILNGVVMRTKNRHK